MISAVSQVFPTTKHNHCIFHIQTNIAKKLSRKFGNSYNDFLQSWFRCRNSRSEAELEHLWEELLNKYPAGKSYLEQLWKSRQSWAKIYVFTTFCAGMQSTQ